MNPIRRSLLNCPPALFIAMLAGAPLLLFVATCADEPSPTLTLTLRVQTHDVDFPAPEWSHQFDDSRLPHARTVDLVLRGAEDQIAPVAGVRVALDLPDGTRLGEAETDVEGLVAFEIEESRWPETGAVSATAYKDGFLMHTLAGIARPSGDQPVALTLIPEWGPPPEMITVSGSALNRSAIGTLYIASTGLCAEQFQADADAWTVETPPGEAFELLATDWIWLERSNWDYDQVFTHWARVSSDALATDTIHFDIDFVADAVEPVEYALSFGLPERSESPLRQTTAFPYGGVAPDESYWSLAVGLLTSARLDGRVVEFTGEMVELPDLGGYSYRYWVAAPRGTGIMSIAYGRGVPEGEQPQLLDLPEWTGEPPGNEGHPIDEPLSWTAFDSDVRPYVGVLTGAFEAVWVVELPSDATTARLPAPPSNVDLAELVGASPMVGVALERRLDSTEGVFLLESWAQPMSLDIEPGE